MCQYVVFPGKTIIFYAVVFKIEFVIELMRIAPVNNR